MTRLRVSAELAWAFIARDFREATSYRLAFGMQFYGIFFQVTLFFFLARVFGVQRVNVLDAISNTGPEEGTEATDFIATNKEAMLTFAPPRPSLLMPSAGYTFAWTGLLGAGAFATRMKRFEMKALEAVRVEGEMAWDQNLVSADLGFFFITAIP